MKLCAPGAKLVPCPHHMLQVVFPSFCINRLVVLLVSLQAQPFCPEILQVRRAHSARPPRMTLMPHSQPPVRNRRARLLSHAGELDSHCLWPGLYSAPDRPA
eukprot:scaffold184918_cov35-Tisochrysis_lutea.AAC.2